MGIDYKGVGGVGVELTKELLKKLKEEGVFTEEEWEEDYTECIDRLNLTWSSAHYYDVPIEEYTFYIFIDGNTITEIKSNIPAFLEALNKYNLGITENDIIPIEDICIR